MVFEAEKSEPTEPRRGEHAIKTFSLYAHKELCSLSCPQPMAGGVGELLTDIIEGVE